MYLCTDLYIGKREDDDIDDMEMLGLDISRLPISLQCSRGFDSPIVHSSQCFLDSKCSM